MKYTLRNMELKNWIQGKLLFILALSFFVVPMACSDDDEYPEYDPPADHTVSKEGVMHKPGLEDPFSDCTTCHGADLGGGTSQVSCFECHGQEW